MSAAALALGLLTSLTAGCQRDDLRTSQTLLSREAGRAFERAYQDRHRMATGAFDEEILAFVASRCDKLEVNPRGERPWRWRCRVSYRSRPGAAGAAVYAVSVNPRGCFTATTAAQPSLAWERVLRRFSRNPLARFHSCP
jgi:hypothetical protein